MTMYYSPTTNGFYDSSFEYPALPADIIEITAEQHLELLRGVNTQNKKIVVDNKNNLALVDNVPVYTWDDIRSLRDKKLKRCDYTQSNDWPGNKEVWAVYRQSLRDIPQSFDNPNNVVWPAVPE